MNNSRAKHLLGFGIDNFRAFQSQHYLDLKAITVLTGTNSSGKSSYVKAMQLFQNQLEKRHKGKLPDFEGLFNLEFIGLSSHLGSFGHVRNNFSSKSVIEFKLPFWWYGLPQEMELTLQYKNDGEINGILTSLVVQDKSTNETVYSLILCRDDQGKIEEVEHEFFGVYNEYKRYINFKYLKESFDNVISKVRACTLAIFNFNKAIPGDIQIIPTKSSLKKYSSNLDNEMIEKCKKYLAQWEKHKSIINYILIIDKEHIPQNKNGYYNSLFNIIAQEVDDEILMRQQSNKLEKEKNFKVLSSYNEDLPLYTYTYLNKDNAKYYSSDIVKLRNAEMNSTHYFNDYPSPVGYFTLERKLHYSIKEIIDEDYKNTDSKIIFDNVVNKTIGLEYDLKKEECSYGANYYIFIEKYLRDSLMKSITPIFSMINSSSFSFIPSIRSVPSRVLDTNKPNTYIESLVNEIDISDVFKGDLEFFNKWLNEFGIAKEATIIRNPSSGYSELTLDIDGIQTNLSDVGHGYSQLTPILIKCCFDKSSNIIAVEEPETNLHPALQSKLADFFIECIKKYNKQFIIETHSEYLIRKLQYIIARKEFDHDKAIIYYFYPPKKVKSKTSQVKRIDFQKSGVLSGQFGPGFYDEANNLAIDLFQLNKGQDN